MLFRHGQEDDLFIVPTMLPAKAPPMLRLLWPKQQNRHRELARFIFTTGVFRGLRAKLIHHLHHLVGYSIKLQWQDGVILIGRHVKAYVKVNAKERRIEVD